MSADNGFNCCAQRACGDSIQTCFPLQNNDSHSRAALPRVARKPLVVAVALLGIYYCVFRGNFHVIPLEMYTFDALGDFVVPKSLPEFNNAWGMWSVRDFVKIWGTTSEDNTASFEKAECLGPLLSGNNLPLDFEPVKSFKAWRAGYFSKFNRGISARFMNMSEPLDGHPRGTYPPGLDSSSNLQLLRQQIGSLGAFLQFMTGDWSFISPPFRPAILALAQTFLDEFDSKQKLKIVTLGSSTVMSSYNTSMGMTFIMLMMFNHRYDPCSGVIYPMKEDSSPPIEVGPVPIPQIALSFLRVGTERLTDTAEIISSSQSFGRAMFFGLSVSSFSPVTRMSPSVSDMTSMPWDDMRNISTTQLEMSSDSSWNMLAGMFYKATWSYKSELTENPGLDLTYFPDWTNWNGGFKSAAKLRCWRAHRHDMQTCTQCALITAVREECLQDNVFKVYTLAVQYAVSMGVLEHLLSSLLESKYVQFETLTGTGDRFGSRFPGCKHSATHLDIACLMKSLEECTANPDMYTLPEATEDLSQYRTSGTCTDNDEMFHSTVWKATGWPMTTNTTCAEMFEYCTGGPDLTEQASFDTGGNTLVSDAVKLEWNKKTDLACPYTCGKCNPSTGTAQRCVQVTQLMYKLSSILEETEPAVVMLWDRIVAKAAFESQVESLGTIAITLIDGRGERYGAGIPPWRPVNPSKTSVRLMQSYKISQVFEVQLISLIWIVMSFGISLVVVAEITSVMANPIRGEPFSLRAFISGTIEAFDYELGCADELGAGEKDQVLFSSGAKRMIATKVVVHLGCLIGEACLPTHQCYPQWLWIDCTLGANQVMFMLLPRISYLFTGVVVFDIFSVEHTIGGLIAVAVLIPLIAASLAAIVLASEFSDVDMIYFLMPLILQITMVAVTISVIIWYYRKAPDAPWTKLLNVYPKVSTQIERISMKTLPPLWMHVAAISLSESSLNGAVQCFHTVIEWQIDNCEDSANTALVMLDAAAPDEKAPGKLLNTVNVDEVPASAGQIDNCLITSLFALQRMPQTRDRYLKDLQVWELMMNIQ